MLIKFARLFILSLLIFSCSDENNLPAVSIGNSFIKPQTQIVMVDTFTVNLSTVKIDSIQTSGSGVLLAGSFDDPDMGRVSSTGFFQVAIPDTTELAEGSVFDSLTLILDYNGKWYGDTLQPYTLNIYRVTEEIATNDDSYLYNTSDFVYDPNPLGTATVKPKPNFYSTIEIKLSDTFGKELTGLLLENSDKVASTENFIEYFKGIAVGPAPGDAALLGFEASDSSLNMVLYTHYIGEEKIEVSSKFPMYLSETCFNHVETDRSGTSLYNLAAQKIEIPSAETGNRTFLQSGSGIVTRIDFPGLNKLLEFDSGNILYKAELILKPYPSSYTKATLPEQIIFYTTDKYNRLISNIQDSDGNAITADFHFDDLYNENTWYQFDVTDFIMDELADTYFDTDVGLIAMFPEDSFQASFDRIVFDARQSMEFKPVLKLYFLFYN